MAKVEREEEEEEEERRVKPNTGVGKSRFTMVYMEIIQINSN